MAKKVITDSGQVASDALWQDTSQQPLDAYSFEETLADASQRLAATAVKKKGMIKRLLSTCEWTETLLSCKTIVSTKLS